MLFFIFWPLPEKLLDCPKKKLFCPTLGGCSPPSPPAHTPMPPMVQTTEEAYKNCQAPGHAWHFATDSLRELVIENVAVLGELPTTDYVVERGIASHYSSVA